MWNVQVQKHLNLSLPIKDVIFFSSKKMLLSHLKIMNLWLMIKKLKRTHAQVFPEHSPCNKSLGLQLDWSWYWIMLTLLLVPLDDQIQTENRAWDTVSNFKTGFQKAAVFGRARWRFSWPQICQLATQE